MSSQFGPRQGAGGVSTGIARDPAQLVPIHLNINYETELGIATYVYIYMISSLLK